MKPKSQALSELYGGMWTCHRIVFGGGTWQSDDGRCVWRVACNCAVYGIDDCNCPPQYRIYGNEYSGELVHFKDSVKLLTL